MVNGKKVDLDITVESDLDASNKSNAYSSIYNLKHLTIPSSVTALTSYYFSVNENLESVTFNSQASSLTTNIFSYCPKLGSFTIPNTVKSINASAFAGCSSLSEMHVPASVSSITTNVNQPFRGCSGITSMTVDEQNTYYDSRDNCNAIIRKSNNTMICGFKTSTIPSSISGLGMSCFNGVGLETITVPENIKSISTRCFANNTKLRYFKNNGSAVMNGANMFNRCLSLETVYLGDYASAITSQFPVVRALRMYM